MTEATAVVDERSQRLEIRGDMALFYCTKLNSRHHPNTCLTRYEKYLKGQDPDDRVQFRMCGECEDVLWLIEHYRDRCPYCGRQKWVWERCKSVKCRARENVKKLKAVEEGESRMPARRNQEEKVVCTICGTRFEPYRNGPVVVRRVCRSCLKHRRESGAGYLKIDLRNFPDVTAWLAELAQEELRTVEGQAAYLIVQAYRNAKAAESGEQEE